MIEENIIECLELGDSIQKLDLYKNNKNLYIYKINYLLSQHSNFPQLFYLLIIFLYFGQIWELNILKIEVEGDGFLEIIKYIQEIFLLEEIVKNNATFITFIIVLSFLSLFSLLLGIVNVKLFNKSNHLSFLISLNSFINTINLYYLSGPNLQITFSSILCYEDSKLVLCSFKNTSRLIILIVCIIYGIFLTLSLVLSALYFNDIGKIKSTNTNSKINNNYTLIIFFAKLVYNIFNFYIKFFISNNNHIIIYIYYLLFIIGNISISIYAYQKLFYYNYLIDTAFHFGGYYTTWFSICIFFKKLIGIQDITLFVIFGLILITIGFHYANKYRSFLLITQFNIFEANNLKDIEIYNCLLLNLVKQNDHKSKILITGVIKKFENYLNNSPELNEQYHKLISDKHLQKKFTSNNELKILSIILIIYSYNIDKSRDATDIILNMCYFLINKFKNPLYAIWLCTKIKSSNNIQSFYRYALMEQIKEYLIGILNKNTNKITIKHVQISTLILYNQYVDLFKIKIYDATCNQLEYFDILKNNITTIKTTENFLKIGEDILTLRQDILYLWEKLILLNPFSNESESDYMIYLETILQDDALMRTEEKRFNTLKAEKLFERNNPYYSMFIQEISSIILVDGYSYSGKILYATPNFPSLFMFNAKEFLNSSIDDLLPEVIQNFHRYLIEDAIKYSNLGYIFKTQRDVLLRGKNGIMFNVYLYVKPSPNLSFGLIYFAYLQKIQEQNFIIILNENLIINGFIGMNHIGSNFTINNNYGLSYNINGHHIGILIPEILLQMNYDIKSNNFLLSKNNIDIKGNLYSINNFKDLDDKLSKILEIIKEKNTSENNDNKIVTFEEYEEYIKSLNIEQPKPYSIFFRIEAHKFIGGKYKYYRIYIINDLLSGNENSFTMESNINTIITNEDNNHNLKETIDPKMKFKEKKKVNNYTITSNKINNPNISNKYIRLKTEYKNNILNKDEEEDKLNEKNKHREINLIENENKNNINNSNNNNKTRNINFSKPSNPSSILTQSSAESPEFNKLKNEIINKNDSFYVKLMKYLYYIFIIFNILLIAYDYFKSKKIINAMIEYLRENLFFTHTKISAVCVYNSAFNLILIKEKYIKDNSCIDNPCHKIYANMLLKCLREIKNEKNNISYYYSDFQHFFNQKFKTDLYVINSNDPDHLYLDIDNYLNLIISQGMKIISNLTDIYNNTDEFNSAFMKMNIKNVLVNSLNYFNSNFSGFVGKEKEQRCDKVSSNLSISLYISIGIIIILIFVFSYYIYKINIMEIYFLDKLINFSSTNFDEYLKKLEELKKKFKDDDNEEGEKNLEDFDVKGDDIDGKNENKSKDNNNKNELKNNNYKNSKNKKEKQNKIQQQKLKKKKIMSHYFVKLNFLFGLKISFIVLTSIIYFILIMLITLNIKNSYKKFDSVLEEINKVYFDSFNIFLVFKSQVEIYFYTNDITKLITLSDSQIERPKFGNALISIIRNNKYSEEPLKLMDKLYNNNACQILSNNNNATYKVCEDLFSSILTKGMEQAIVQMNIIITSSVDEINSLKENKTLYDLYLRNSIYSDYEILVGEFMLESFLKTQNIFEILRLDEKSYIFKTYKICLFVFCIIYLIFLIFMIYYIYSYKNVINSFFNFIGILPAKFITDDDYLYKTIIKLEQNFY